MHYKNIEGSGYYWSKKYVTPSKNGWIIILIFQLGKMAEAYQEDKVLNSEES